MKPDAYIAERGSEAITQLGAEQDEGPHFREWPRKIK